MSLAQWVFSKKQPKREMLKKEVERSTSGCCLLSLASSHHHSTGLENASTTLGALWNRILLSSTWKHSVELSYNGKVGHSKARKHQNEDVRSFNLTFEWVYVESHCIFSYIKTSYLFYTSFPPQSSFWGWFKPLAADNMVNVQVFLSPHCSTHSSTPNLLHAIRTSAEDKAVNFHSDVTLALRTASPGFHNDSYTCPAPCRFSCSFYNVYWD